MKGDIYIDYLLLTPDNIWHIVTLDETSISFIGKKRPVDTSVNSSFATQSPKSINQAEGLV
jgi:hypothetical protein